MNRYLALSIVCFFTAVMVGSLGIFFATGAEAFDGVQSASFIDVSIRGVPVWALVLIFALTGTAFSAFALLEQKIKHLE